MLDRPVSQRVDAIGASPSLRLVTDFYFNVVLPACAAGGDVIDFTIGNPHEMPLPGVVQAFRTWIEPRDNDWFAYKVSERRSQEVVASSLRDFLGMPFEPEDIAMTTGGFGAIAAGLKAVADPGDEVVYSLPPWFNYEPMVIEAGLVPVKVTIDLDTFDLDLDAIAGAITERTRIVIVNTPQNPTGKVLSADMLTRLAALLEDASQRNGRRVYLLSDEAYNRIVFPGARHRSPVEYYPWSMLAYSYGKTLLMPGQRIGYLAFPPTMPLADRELLRGAVQTVQLFGGFLFPNALLQHAIGDLEGMTLDLDHLQRKRDRMVDALLEMGYEVRRPEGTFYLFPKSPIEDDLAFTELLKAEGVLVLPGTVFETPGFFRICLTANDAMIERGLPGFAAAIAKVRDRPVAGGRATVVADGA